jgi:hypothetical protein
MNEIIINHCLVVAFLGALGVLAVQDGF